MLAFVVPDGGGASRATAEKVPDDEWEKPLTMVAALKADLGAQLSQSIASDLEATRAHNERINARYDLRRSLADLGSRLRDDQPPDGSPPSSDGLITGRMLRDFERQQGSGLAQPLLAEVMRQLTTMQIPAAWADELAPGGNGQSGPAQPRMAKEMVHILGRGWRPQPAPATTESAGRGQRSGSGRAVSGQRGGRGLDRVGPRDGALPESRPVRPAGVPGRAGGSGPADPAGIPAGHHE